MNNIFVGNLSFKTTHEGLKKHFEPCGVVANATVMMDKSQSLGYGFVDMPNIEEKDKAIAELNGKELDGRALAVSVVVARVRHKKKRKKVKKVEKEVKSLSPKPYNKMSPHPKTKNKRGV